jgi:hypothetical protein
VAVFWGARCAAWPTVKAPPPKKTPNKWVAIAKLLPGRSSNCVKNRKTSAAFKERYAVRIASWPPKPKAKAKGEEENGSSEGARWEQRDETQTEVQKHRAKGKEQCLTSA